MPDPHLTGYTVTPQAAAQAGERGPHVSETQGWPPRFTGTAFKAEAPSRLDTKRERSAAKEANWRAVCKQVDRRDNFRCRACHDSVRVDAIDPLERGHRHHLQFRSKGGQDVASNLLLLCPRCHDFVHVKRSLRFEWGTYGADGPIEVWRLRDGEWYQAHREKSVGQVERD